MTQGQDIFPLTGRLVITRSLRRKKLRRLYGSDAWSDRLGSCIGAGDYRPKPNPPATGEGEAGQRMTAGAERST